MQAPEKRPDFSKCKDLGGSQHARATFFKHCSSAFSSLTLSLPTSYLKNPMAVVVKHNKLIQIRMLLECLRSNAIVLQTAMLE